MLQPSPKSSMPPYGVKWRRRHAIYRRVKRRRPYGQPSPDWRPSCNAPEWASRKKPSSKEIARAWRYQRLGMKRSRGEEEISAGVWHQYNKSSISLSVWYNIRKCRRQFYMLVMVAILSSGAAQNVALNRNHHGWCSIEIHCEGSQWPKRQAMVAKA